MKGDDSKNEFVLNKPHSMDDDAINTEKVDLLRDVPTKISRDCQSTVTWSELETAKDSLLENLKSPGRDKVFIVATVDIIMFQISCYIRFLYIFCIRAFCLSSSVQVLPINLATPLDSFAWNYSVLASLLTRSECLAEGGLEPLTTGSMREYLHITIVHSLLVVESCVFVVISHLADRSDLWHS